MSAPRSKMIAVFLLSTVLTLVPALAQDSAKPAKTAEAFQRSEIAMKELAADTKRILGVLEGLTEEQKSAVVALMALGRAAAAYESRVPEMADTSLREFYGTLRQFGPAYITPEKPQSVMGPCFGASVSCLIARKECLDSGKKEDECDRDPKVSVPCANEAICFMNWFEKLHRGIPEILRGTGPWPLPLPY